MISAQFRILPFGYIYHFCFSPSLQISISSHSINCPEQFINVAQILPHPSKYNNHQATLCDFIWKIIQRLSQSVSRVPLTVTFTVISSTPSHGHTGDITWNYTCFEFIFYTLSNLLALSSFIPTIAVQKFCKIFIPLTPSFSNLSVLNVLAHSLSCLEPQEP